MVSGSRFAIALLLAAVVLSGCTTSVPGDPVRAGGSRPSGPISAQALLLQDGDDTPLGRASAAPVGDNYFTSVQPPVCSAALLFKGSPLRPSGASDFAESAYELGGSSALYAESIDVYDYELNTHEVVWSAFSKVSDCHDDAVGVSPTGPFRPMRLGTFGIPEDEILTWTMTRPDWTCTYGLTAVLHVVLLMTVCDRKAGYPMVEWAGKRKAQLEGRTA
ncbi:hypothetical protein BST27_11055 [Mycobacterium intermedium]|uniref:Lipoprotein LprH n=1 Tax=Mycobacterium intermedium TaxID=28445 RepID=A0A1E3SJB4_MYCIE|nr:hypothetical protein [Mycobacterium intermedium]MCV6964875.1 hypothetical protein [Mycobacterium intermedium]ODR01648.1 hypothetical protein BHQ20_07585 [Mycobacterium intermedium]OPE45243.1 hypothetical protein BV508_30285 [Mycobacterium intermedium]ORB06298.1 hypothetical protein BST27_11055 [Mycobacterium intermedium]